jgi:hypothetical protein
VHQAGGENDIISVFKNGLDGERPDIKIVKDGPDKFSGDGIKDLQVTASFTVASTWTNTNQKFTCYK